jgi:hypothetical protein
MGNNQAELFQTGMRISQTLKSGSSLEPYAPAENYSQTHLPILTDIDNKMIDTVSAYIKKLPDNNTKKHIARIMINFIINSANL